MLYILIAVLAVLLIAAVVFSQYRKSKGISASLPQTEKLDIVTLKDVIAFFKQPEVLALLKQSEDRIAVAIREKQHSGGYRIILCIFSKKTSNIVQPLRLIETSVLEPELLSLFGEKDMLVLQ